MSQGLYFNESAWFFIYFIWSNTYAELARTGNLSNPPGYWWAGSRKRQWHQELEQDRRAWSADMADMEQIKREWREYREE